MPPYNLLIAASCEASINDLKLRGASPNSNSVESVKEKLSPKVIFDASQILKILPSGGSSIYDTLYRQYRNLERFDGKDYSKNVIIITDGGDKNSIRKLQDLISLVSSNISANNSQKSGFTSLHIIGINNGSGELESLKSIAEAAAGNFYEVNSDSLPKLLTELESFLL